MDFSEVFARVVAQVGDAAIVWRRMQGVPSVQAVGTAPAIPAAKPQGALPTLKMPTAKGWPKGEDAGCGARARSECVRDRVETSPLDSRAA